jgi:membrane-bound inhibitor of C-type lysozyme
MRFLKAFLTAGCLMAAAACGAEGGDQNAGTDEAESVGTDAAQAQTGQTAMPEGHPAVEGMEAGPAVTRISYICAGDQRFEAAFMEGQRAVTLAMDGTVYELTLQESESGLLFSDGSLTLHGQGMAAFVERDGELLRSDCKATGHATEPVDKE